MATARRVAVAECRLDGGCHVVVLGVRAAQVEVHHGRGLPAVDRGDGCGLVAGDVAVVPPGSAAAGQGVALQAEAVGPTVRVSGRTGPAGQQVARVGVGLVGTGLEILGAVATNGLIMLPIRNRLSPRIGAWLFKSATPLVNTAPPSRTWSVISAPGPPSCVAWSAGAGARGARGGWRWRQRWWRTRGSAAQKRRRTARTPCHRPPRQVPGGRPTHVGIRACVLPRR